MRHRVAALVSAVLALATATLALSSPARAVVAGLSVQITRLPPTFVAGGAAGTVTAVLTSRQQGTACRQVRWSMLLRTEGVRLDQVQVERLENEKQFGLRVRTDGNAARLTDLQFDPGQLCPGRTVTSTYRVAFTGGKGSATFQIDALDAAGRLLQSATATSRVATAPAAAPVTPPAKSAAPTDSPTDSPTVSPTGEPSASDDSGGVAGADDGDTAAPAGPPVAAAVPQNEASANARTPSLLGPGLIVGGILVFLGVALLLRMRSRNQRQRYQASLTPTSFYPSR